jgi:peptidoglycan/LPS O-acetylase OafA/YrhL
MVFKIEMTAKLDYLDGVRGIACLIVVMDHWLTMGMPQNPLSASLYPQTSVFWEPWLFHTPLRIAIAGEFAVAVFFVLSGFVLLIKAFTIPGQAGGLLSRAALGRLPRLWLPTTFTALFYYAWLHFGPFQGGLVCHAVGDMDQYVNASYARYFTPGEMVYGSLVGQWLYQDSIYSIQWTLQVPPAPWGLVHACAPDHT